MANDADVRVGRPSSEDSQKRVNMRIAIGANHSGHVVRGMLIDFLRQHGHEVLDLGVRDSTPVDYPDIAVKVVAKVSGREVERGILVGGTGIGMGIVANKFPGVRAVPCHDGMTADISRRHHDSNVLCISADLSGERTIQHMVETWLTTRFEEGRHARRIDKIAQIERDVKTLD